MVNRDEIARRVAAKGNYEVGAVKHVLELSEDVMDEALRDNESVKFGKLFKIILQELPRKRAWDGLNKEHFIREPKKVPKLKPLSRLSKIELPVEEEE